MKNSGIPWIGDIPKDWGINLLSSLFDEHKQKNKDLAETNLLSLSYGRIVTRIDPYHRFRCQIITHVYIPLQIISNLR